MKSTTKLIFAAVVLAAMNPPMVFADGCRDNEKAVEIAALKKAEDHEKAGRLKEAFNAAQPIGECLNNEANKRRNGIVQRSGKVLGAQEEKAGRLKEAFNWYEKSGNKAEADQVKMKQVGAKPDDAGTVGDAISHFTYRNNAERVKELRGLAARNADKWLAAEDKAFGARKDSLDELGKARDWTYYAEAGAAKVTERAVKRGDALAADSARRALESAIAYYEFAEKPQKVKSVKDKARQLGDAHAKKGEKKIAADYYVIAGLDSQAEKLAETHEAEKEKAEVKRQDKFKKDQKSLEKELGL